MKKLFQTFGASRAPALNQSQHGKKKNSVLRIATLGCMVGALLLASCSDTTGILDPDSTARINEDQVFSLVPAQEVPIHINASPFGPESLAGTKETVDDRGRFNIELKYLVEVSTRHAEVFEEAAARWERIIIKDVPSITGSIPSAFIGFPPVVDDTTLDDIIIEVVLAPIDGPGNVLGQAGPVYVRTADRLPLSGVMYFDVEDLDYLEELDLFEDVIVHEMGHVLGVGSLWTYTRSLRQGPSSDPYFTGMLANTHWGAEGGTDALPIENMGGPGTALAHWRESALRNELMTGYINLGVNPLSRITAGSVGDLGYGAALVGEQYELERGTPGVDISELAEGGSEQGIHIAEREIILEPIGTVTTGKQ